MAQDEPHIALTQLWEYRNDPNSATTPIEVWFHLANCQDCVARLWLCRASSSIDDVRVKIKKYFVRRTTQSNVRESA